MTDHVPPTPSPRGSELTVLLRAASAGDPLAFDRAFQCVYDELREIAARVRGAQPSDTLGPTALVHEAYLKLAPGAPAAWEGRQHFLRLAARAMRQVLVDGVRERQAAKRGGGEFAVTLDEKAFASPMRPAELLALDEALTRLAEFDARLARVVELRYFTGLTSEEIAEVLGNSVATVQRDWRMARAWLAVELGQDA